MTRDLTDAWTFELGDGDPIAASSIHSGHALRDEVRAALASTEDERRREEDPFTEQWTQIAANRLVVHRSRFEFDLNRPREACVYASENESWGVPLWARPPAAGLLERSRALHEQFYHELAEWCDALVDRHGRVLVLDLHAYNHRRSGPDQPVDDPDRNPEINVGSESAPLSWRPLVDAFVRAAADHPFEGGYLDVRENVRFRGGHFVRWINQRYEGRVCALALEVKKVFMDEWTGHLDEPGMAGITEVLHVATDAVRSRLLEDASTDQLR